MGHGRNNVELAACANGPINHTGPPHVPHRQNNTLLISTWHKIVLSQRLCFLLYSRRISRQPLQDNVPQLPRAKRTVALTNVVFSEQEALCYPIRFKYLLFISAKARGRKEREGKGRRERMSE